MTAEKSPAEKKNHFRELIIAYASLLALAGTVIVLDQITKHWVYSNLSLSEAITPISSLPFLRIIHWQNTGAAFGMLQDFGGVFAILAVVVAVLIVAFFPRIERGDWMLRLAMGLQLGGAIGNLLDRLQHGYVVDFVSVGNFAVFNVADASITVGTALLLLTIWLGDGFDEDEKQEPVKEHLPSE